ncbi:MAG: hypothetical protein ABW146_10185 [Candidatus Sedimenticola sp. 6PFRAG7]
MSMQSYSEEVISAFVDGELDHGERLELLEAASSDDALRLRICESQRLKEMVREAYPPAVESRPGERSGNSRLSLLRYGAAAAIASLALYSVLSLNQPPGLPPAVSEGAVSENDVLLDADDSQRRVLFHISSNDPETAGQLFEQVELVLRSHAESGQQVRVEVVANNQGLRVLQQGHSLFASRIKTLHEQYPNLVFAACGNTMDRFQKRFGESVKVLPQAVIIRSGVALVTRRQELGWSYIKV